MEENTLLEVKDLRVVYKTDEATVHAVNGISFTLGVSGDVVSACGGWSCPEFFTAFSDAL